jgi:hypothetical protein
MNGYGLIAATIQSIASLSWPVAIIAVVWIFRTRIADLLPLLRVKYKDLELSYRLDMAEKDAAGLPEPAKDQVATSTPEEEDRFIKIAKLSPRGAIMDLRRELEEALRNYGNRPALETRRFTNLLSMTRELRREGLIGPRTSALLDDLRTIGNTAAHGESSEEFTKDLAIRYRELFDHAIAALQEMPAP